MYGYEKKTVGNKLLLVANTHSRQKNDMGFQRNRPIQRRVLKAHPPRLGDPKPFDQVNINTMMPQQIEVERAADVLSKKTGQDIQNFNKVKKLYSTDVKEGEEHIIGHGDSKNIAARPNEEFHKELISKTDSDKEYLLYIYSCFAAPALRKIGEKESNLEMHGPDGLALLNMGKNMRPEDATVKDYKAVGQQIKYNDKRFDEGWKRMGENLREYLVKLITKDNALNIKNKGKDADEKVKNATNALAKAKEKEGEPRAYVNALRTVGKDHSGYFIDKNDWQKKYTTELFEMSDLITNTNIEQTSGERKLSRIGKVDRVKKSDPMEIVKGEKAQDVNVNTIVPEISLERVVNINSGLLNEDEEPENNLFVQPNVSEEIDDDLEERESVHIVGHEEEPNLQQTLNQQPGSRKKKKKNKKNKRSKKVAFVKKTLDPSEVRKKMQTYFNELKRTSLSKNLQIKYDDLKFRVNTSMNHGETGLDTLRTDYKDFKKAVSS